MQNFTCKSQHLNIARDHVQLTSKEQRVKVINVLHVQVCKKAYLALDGETRPKTFSIHRAMNLRPSTLQKKYIMSKHHVSSDTDSERHVYVLYVVKCNIALL